MSSVSLAHAAPSPRDDNTAHATTRLFARLLRLALAGLTAALAVVGGGWIYERAHLGTSEASARTRVADDVRSRIHAIIRDLDRAADRARVDARPLRAAPLDAEATRTLFTAASDALGNRLPGLFAITLYNAAGAPLAWAGRPSELPADRLAGPRALFIVPGPFGPRLVRTAPMTDGAGRAGVVAVEHVLGGASETPGTPVGHIRVGSGDIPVTLRARYEGAGDVVGDGFVVRDLDGAPLLEAAIVAGSLEATRDRWRARARSAALFVVALTLGVLAVPLVEERGRARTARRYLASALGVAALVTLARLALWPAVWTEWHWPLQPASRAAALLLRSPADLLATAVCAIALLLVGVDAVERWRLARRGRWHGVSATVAGHARFAALQAAAGVLLAAGLVAHHRLVARMLAPTGLDPLQFSLHPLDPARVAFVLGLVLWQALVFWSGVLLLRAAATAWPVRRSERFVRGLTGAAWLAPTFAWASRSGAGEATAWALVASAAAIVAAAVVARWVMPRYRHASQALRLTTVFAALVVPALVFYPGLVALGRAATERVIEQDLGPRALAHRNELQIHLQRSLEQIDALEELPDLIARAEREPNDPVPPEAAFQIWQQTELARLRLTSSVELYAADGTLVSRFALNLPADSAAIQSWTESACAWDIFGEPLPGTEDRVLLHAGRGLCPHAPAGPTPPGTRPTGAIVVHAMLDYATLPFLPSQDPYGELGAEPRSAVGSHGRQVTFAMYGWGRTPIFPAEGTAWPISRELLDRIYRAGRTPIWEEVARAERRYRVYFLNDRSGIYALGYAVPGTTDHLVAGAEIVTLAAAAYVLLLVGLTVLGTLGGYRPTSARALLREIRGSFYRKLFLAFVAAAVVPVLALAVLTRAYIAGQLRDGIESAAERSAAIARRVVEDVMSQQRRQTGAPQLPTDEMLISVSRVIDQDVNVFQGPRLQATSQRDLFASGRVPSRTPSEVYRAVVLNRQASYVGEEQFAQHRYMLAAAPVREGDGRTLLTVPQALRQQEIERDIDALDRRVLLAALCFILLGAGIGYSMAERIADPVNRLTRATNRIARGDLDARIVTSSADEFRRLVDAFNRMAADLQRQRVELERTNRLAAWADMARQVAHDIKNPLTPVQLSAEHLRRVHRDRGQPLGPVLDGCIDTILSQVRLLRQLSSEFSSFASSPVPRPAPTRLADVVDEVLQPYRSAPPDRVTLDVQLDPALPPLVIDRTLLGRALVNIVENALHAMPAGGTLRVITVRAGAAAELRVSDTGVGMDADALAHIFEPYFSTRASGTGLGLTIAKRNVELNGGSIAVASQPGRGTTVTIALPIPGS